MEVAHLNQKQLAARWSISEATVERWRSEGIGPKFLKLCGRVRRGEPERGMVWRERNVPKDGLGGRPAKSAGIRRNPRKQVFLGAALALSDQPPFYPSSPFLSRRHELKRHEGMHTPSGVDSPTTKIRIRNKERTRGMAVSLADDLQMLSIGQSEVSGVPAGGAFPRNSSKLTRI